MIDNKCNLQEAITYIADKRDDLLYTLTDRIKNHFGTEEELIKELKEVIRFNNSHKILKDGFDEFNEVLRYMEINENKKII